MPWRSLAKEKSTLGEKGKMVNSVMEIERKIRTCLLMSFDVFSVLFLIVCIEGRHVNRM